MNEDSIFAEALAITDPLERSVYLERTCGNDRGLRERVEDLLSAHTEAGSFMETPALAQGQMQETPPSEATRAFAPDAEKARHILEFLQPPSREDSLGRLDHYEILEVIGKGGMGIVLRAFDERLQRIVAVKVMAPALAATGAARQRFIREARAAAAVNHENVINIHAVEPEGPVPYLVMECIHGQSLEEKIKRVGLLPVEDVLRIGLQIAEGLQAAHRRGLIHRDIKPANILLMNGVEKVKITDFGLARITEDASVTQSGVIAGTPQYMSPEQAEGHALDARSDLFSLGSVLYAMCTGRPPFRAATTMGVLKRVCEEEPRPIREINPAVPERLCALIAQLQAKNPKDRCQSAAEAAQELGKLMTSMPADSMPDRSANSRNASPAAPPRRSRRWTVVLAVLAGAFLLLLAAIIYIQNGRGQFVIETDDPDFAFEVNGDAVTLRDRKTNRGYVLKVGKRDAKTGEYQLDVSELASELGFTARTFTIKRGEKVALKAWLTPPVAQSGGQSPAEKWLPLFNGKDLTGWKTHPDAPGNWRVEDGAIVGRGATSFLFTESADYADFHLRVEARINATGDAGVWFRLPFEIVAAPDDITRRSPTEGYEAQIGVRSNYAVHTGSLNAVKDPGVQQSPLIQKSELMPHRPDEWFVLEIIARGSQLQTRVNGQVAAEYQEERYRFTRGHIALQTWGRNITYVQFRKIEIKVLPQADKPAMAQETARAVPSLKLTAEEEALLEGINKERARTGAPPLRPQHRLFQAARRHCDDMARWDALTHDSEDKGPAERLREIGYDFSALAENVAWGQDSPEAALASWLASPSHKENLLNPHVTELGVASSRGASGRFWAAVFAAPRVASQKPLSPDRRAAEWFLQREGSVVLFMEEIDATGVLRGGGKEFVVRTPQQLPPDEFALRAVSSANGKATGEGLALLRGLKKLSSVEIVSDKLTDADIEHLAQIPGLRNLTLASAGLGERTPEILSRIATLSNLNLSLTPISPAGLERLAGLPELRELNLGSRRRTAAELEKLVLFPRLIQLQLSRADIHDDDLKPLARLETLHVLILDATPIGDAGLEHLAGLHRLLTLDLADTSVTREGVKKLQDRLPQCRIRTSRDQPAPADQP